MKVCQWCGGLVATEPGVEFIAGTICVYGQSTRDLMGNDRLTQLQAQVSQLEKENAELRQQLAQSQADLLAKLERYEKALTFYSDSKRWEKCYAVGGICDSIEDGDPMMVFLDGEDHPWSVAREALKGDK